jgi:hypothetical protein
MQRYEFRYGFSPPTRTARRTGAILLTIAFVPVTACLGGVLTSLSIGLFGDGPAALLALPIGLTVLLVAGAVAAGVIVIRRISHLAAWLEGHRLIVREWRSRSADLTRVRAITIRPTRYRWQHPPVGVADAFLPEILVTDPSGTVRMRLSDADRNPLPAADLRVLAQALSGSPAPGANEAVGYLTAMAARVPG